MDGDLFGVPSSRLDHYNQVSSVPEGVCRCKKRNCPLTHYQNEDGTDGPWQTPTPSPAETAFRHSGWAVDRQRVQEALFAAGVPATRLERFRACGASAYVEYNPLTQRYRVRAFFCGDRFCVPCSRARASRGRRAIMALAKGRTLRFVTLTRKSKDEALTDAIDHLLRSFRRLRSSKAWSESVTGGVGVVEVKRGAFSGRWHVHLHLLVVGRWIDKKSLAAAWLRATGDSFILDVRPVPDEARGVGYVCKYLGKGFDRSVFADGNDLAECISALRGRRLLIPFGEWFGRLGDLEFDEAGQWKLVGGLHTLIAEARAGDEHAVRVFTALWHQRGEIEDAMARGERWDEPRGDS